MYYAPRPAPNPGGALCSASRPKGGRRSPQKKHRGSRSEKRRVTSCLCNQTVTHGQIFSVRRLGLNSGYLCPVVGSQQNLLGVRGGRA